MTTTLFDKIYSDEALGQDVQEDIYYACLERPCVDVPLDEYGFRTGTFRVVVTWEPDDE